MLAASLTVENKRQPINNINDLRKQLNPDDPNHIRFGFKGGGTTQSFFAESQIGKIEKENICDSIVRCLVNDQIDH